MTVRSGFLESIGNTPLIRLRAASELRGCEIYGKAEFLNPGGPIKDRAALAIIKDAEDRGKGRVASSSKVPRAMSVRSPQIAAFIWAINREVMAPGEGLEIRNVPTARSVTPCSPPSRRGLATADEVAGVTAALRS
jgi:hypothetical protein